MRIKGVVLRRIGILAAAVAAIALGIPSMSSAKTAGTIVFTGSAFVTCPSSPGGGMAYPVAMPPFGLSLAATPARQCIWGFSSSMCINGISNFNKSPKGPVAAGLGCTITAAGNVTGWCGLLNGAGSGSFTDSTGNSIPWTNLSFTGLGGAVMLHGGVEKPNGQRGVLSAIVEIIDPVLGSGSCLNQTATSWTLAGVAEFYMAADPTTTAPSSSSSTLLPTVTLPTLATSTTHPSDDCVGGTTLTDGFVAGTYGKLAVRQPDPTTVWVCARIDGVTRFGGKAVITNPSGTPLTTSTDTVSGACNTTAGNTVPGPHPLVSGSIGPPLNSPYLIDTYNAAGSTWMCFRFGATELRVRATTGTVGTPSVTFQQDAAGEHVGTRLPPPAMSSGSCQSGVGGMKTEAANGTFGGVPVWTYAWEPGAGIVKLCARIGAPVNLGGHVTINPGGTTGFVPAVTTSTTDLSPCTVPVLLNDNPVQVHITRSPDGATPASACVMSGTTKLRVTVAPGPGGAPPTVTWTPDPGTPG